MVFRWNFIFIAEFFAVSGCFRFFSLFLFELKGGGGGRGGVRWFWWFFLVDFWRFARQDLVNFWQVLDVVIYFEKNNLK